MALQNVYQVLRSNSTVVNTVGTRIYRHGSAPQDVQKPYITWFVVTGQPEDILNAAPPHDRDTIQIDCWAETDTSIETLAYAVRSALDNQLISNRIIIDSRETDTKLYRMALEADFIASR
jgi:Protein of unknown function (DUF3168)